MIKVKKIEIVEFRGIRKLKIDFNQNNFAICGRNGTGKSGVVDALEFALTGNISRLSGSGSGEVSVKEHAPHVDSRNNPEKAYVILTVFIPSLNVDVIIKRNVKDFNSPTITPSSTEILQILKEVAEHPEFTLSRREIINYVISAPGKRAQEVQALLRLDKVENLRTILLKISNSLKKEALAQIKEKEVSQQSLLRALQITDLNKGTLLKIVNSQRQILGLPDITTLTSTTSLKDGLVVTPVAQLETHIPKIQALAEIKKINELFTTITSTETLSLILNIKTKLTKLATDPVANDGVKRENFLKSAVELISGEICPVCDAPCDPIALKKLIALKLKHFDTITVKRTALEKETEPLIDFLNQLAYSIKNICECASKLKPAIDTSAIKVYLTKIKSDSKTLETFIPLIDTIHVMENYTSIPSDVTEIVTKIEDVIKAIPDASKQDTARDYLIIGQERLEAYRGISFRYKQTDEKAKNAIKIFDIYAKVSTEFLDTIYKEVQKDFIDLYRIINKEDEGDFKAELTPSIGKLSFDYVLCTEVLEHIPEPGIFIDEVYRILKSEGRALFTVPWSARYHYIPNDYYRYTPSTLQKLFSNFKEATIKTRGTDLTVICSKSIVFYAGLVSNILRKEKSFLKYIYKFIVNSIFAILLLPICLLLAVIGHISLLLNIGSSDDCLGYTILIQK